MSLTEALAVMLTYQSQSSFLSGKQAQALEEARKVVARAADEVVNRAPYEFATTADA